MFWPTNRRGFLKQAASLGATAALCRAGVAAEGRAEVPDHTLTVISGSPRERGREYGRIFEEQISAFLEKEIYQVCAPTASQDDLRRYAGACAGKIQEFSPLVMDELEGMAEGAGLPLEEVVLITLHEEVAGHRGGKLPPVQHCTALAAGPPDTRDGNTYVGQNWDWMSSVYGLSSMLHWQRPEGPSVLAYAYPGLWAGAGLNSAGIALCWTWGDGLGIEGPRVGIPAYCLIAQMLYQETLAAALEEVRRAEHAGWFCFVLADGAGRLAAVDGTPHELKIESPRGHTARASYGCGERLGGVTDAALTRHPQCQRMFDLLEGARGELDTPRLKDLFADHGLTICKHPVYDAEGNFTNAGFTVDSMLFNCTTREAHIQRGPGCSGRWQTFGFSARETSVPPTP